MGRYSDYATVEGQYGIFEFTGHPTNLSDVYELELIGTGAKVGSVTLTLRFDPQGGFVDGVDAPSRRHRNVPM
ncbi:hypothetical protein DDZ14_11520 [Maritimibacter sp. 55A14]|uniref:hypothetical protein n=1 Tax=Maritimibacter sp. 55A14 TaxID=2174844 RepID=UPI000D60744C|nr:hypothetical protein [Maritimibacter sp. 55A14]PWE32345.1 hypothetical protein DDZ14_11520 [Maritimibacter sp. 55A14]